MSRARVIAGRVALIATGLLLALVLSELGLRAAGLYAPVDAQLLRLPGVDAVADPYTRRDELLIFALQPGSKTFDWYSIDSHGFRTPPFSDSKPAGSFRVITTGDSCTFGLAMLEHQHWSAVLRRALTGLCAGEREVEVVNAGITGYSTLQNRLQIERDLLPLQPDLVAWLVTGANDVSLVEGPGDAEQSASLRSPLRALARLRVAGLLGLGRYGWRGLSPNAVRGSPSARPRVSPDEAEANLQAVAGMLPDRLLIGLFPPQPGYAKATEIAALFARAQAVAARTRLPIVDLRPALAALQPLPLYIDAVHPDPVGHSLIARELLPAVLPRIPLPAERRAWIAAWRAGLAGSLAEQSETLAGPGAPPRFAELAALYREAALDARLERADAALPAAVLEYDPLLGRRCRRLSSARLALGLDGAGPEVVARRDELERFVQPADPLLACFGDEAGLRAASEGERRLARALLAYTAELGLVPLRADTRRGEAARAASPDEAAELLAAVVALDPADDLARYQLALALRRAGRFPEARAEWTRLAEGQAAGSAAPLADFARGLLAYEEGRLDEAERALQLALAGQFSLGYARTLLGQIYLRQDRLDEASVQFALAAGMIGAKDQLPGLLAQIAARRAELEAQGAATQAR